MIDSGDDDAAKYAALEAEMSRPDPELSRMGIDHQVLDDGPPQAERAEPGSAGRESSPQDDPTVQRVYERHVAARQPQPSPQPSPPAQLPGLWESPVEHFHSRVAQLEAMAQHDYNSQQQIAAYQQGKALQDHLSQADAEGRAELGEENFNAAVDHLLGSRREELDRWAPDNSAHAQQLARQHGYQSAQHMKAAIIQAEILGAAQTAAQRGVPLWALAVQLARERGYQVPVAATTSQRRGIAKAVLGARADKDFDAAWALYAKVHKAEDDLARRPR